MRPLIISILLINTLLISQGSFLPEVLATHSSSSNFEDVNLPSAPSLPVRNKYAQILTPPAIPVREKYFDLPSTPGLVREKKPNPIIVSPINRPHESKSSLFSVKEEEIELSSQASVPTVPSKNPLFSERKKDERLVFSAPTNGPHNALKSPPLLSLKNLETSFAHEFILYNMKINYKEKCQKLEYYKDSISLSRLYQKFTGKFNF